MTKKVYEKVEDIPPAGEESKSEEDIGPEPPKEPEAKEKPCQKKKNPVAPPHLPVGCTHD